MQPQTQVNTLHKNANTTVFVKVFAKFPLGTF